MRTRLIIALGLLGVLMLSGAVWFSGLLSPTPPGVVQQVGDVRLTLNVVRNAAGPWQIELFARNAWGRPVALTSASAHFVMPLVCTNEVRAELMPAAPGKLAASDAQFVMSGVWTAQVTAARANGEPLAATFMVPVQLAEEQGLAPPTVGALDARVAAGRRLFVANCATCHGDAGRGDGPGATGLAMPNLQEHMAQGKHSDQQVFLFIHRGVPGTAMRGFGQQLTADEIWQLVAYLRTLPREQETGDRHQGGG